LSAVFGAGVGLVGYGCAGNVGPNLYYVSLGDSLSVGTQPDASGMNQTTDNGYADVLYQLLLAQFPNLQLVKLGCLFDPGETTVTMADGGTCDYPEGSQLDAAKEFILANQSNILLVTIDIGVNDLLQSGCIDQGPPLMVDAECVQNFLENVLPPRLTFIMNELFQVATPAGIPVIGLNYYNPFVVVYFAAYQLVAEAIAAQVIPMATPPCQDACTNLICPGQCGADPLCIAACVPPCTQACVTDAVNDAILANAPQETVNQVEMAGIDDLAQAFNFLVLQGVYDLVGFPVADIYTAFMAGDFTLVPAPAEFLPIEQAPVNALKACQYSYMCAPDPVGPNIHATDAGYQVMGQTVFDLFNSL
jgi:lysophospholipase L1-like esterase